MYEYYTQMVWAETHSVGCGRTQFSAYKYTGVSIVCDYGPAGNIIGEPVYTSGVKPCTRYPKMIQNKNYSRLCGEEIPLENDTFYPPFTLQAIKHQCDVLVFLFLRFLLEFLLN